MEHLLYIKYRWKQPQPGYVVTFVLPPCYGKWKQGMSFVGCELQEREADFIYEGPYDELQGMKNSTETYFSNLKQEGVVEYYTIEDMPNPEYN
tara:strand:+ start:217 stop:495 length:279 start_codon:yes stop_codon:yes gene_type:complete